MKLSHLLLFAVAAIGMPVFARPADDMAADVERVRTLFDVPGIAIAVVKDGKVLAARGFGVRKLGEAAPVDGETLFELGANSKAFTAALVAMLVDEGKLGWDDPVTTHLPDFQMFDPYVTREMTIRDLLSNHSGLSNGAGDMLWWPSTNFSTDRIIHDLRFIAPARSFRSGYVYEYLPYIVAGKIVAQEEGTSWGAAVRARILAPLGMTHTTTSLADNAQVADQSAPHARVDGRLAALVPRPTDNAAGAVGINTSAADVAKWMTVLLDAGRLGDGGHLFSAAQAEELWTAQTPIRIRAPRPQLAATKASFAAYGLGFDLRDYKGIKVVSHGGWLPGFSSTIVMVPSAQLGIAILTNAESDPAMNALKYRLLDRYLGLAPTDWIGAYADVAAAAQMHDGAAVPAADDGAPAPDMRAYDGAYRDAWYGGATIKATPDGHVLDLSGTPGLVGALEHVRHDTFIVHWQARSFNADAYVTFARHPDGSIAGMKLAPVSDATDASFDFADLAFTRIPPE